jgi:hypothetical protein
MGARDRGLRTSDRQAFSEPLESVPDSTNAPSSSPQSLPYYSQSDSLHSRTTDVEADRGAVLTFAVRQCQS